uniref:family 43 glycosylhydrolase n=1 Tax=Cellvibrio fontiphilus TaxID=1815559 RepID=UPI002B4BAA3A|nr:family 43 glycosylhydrolase [Cellvibrio fontiphilus]
MKLMRPQSRRLAALLASACALGSLLTGMTAQAQLAPVTAPSFLNASVHDPSVIRVNSDYYVFGSHLAAAKSPDLLKWTSIADGVSPQNPLFTNVVTELAETFSWAESNTLWAADVIQLADGKFYMYYNACRGDAPRSAMGLAVADSVEGPYVDKGIFLKSGMWGLPSEDGTIYDARKHPNAVDPDTFYDAQGNLWMIYGSYSGGIFILKLDPQTGKPLPNQGYGKHLIGGNHSRIEGAYVLYSPHTNYYYMFTSFGGLDAVGGYNMRVARATAPDGPYYDAQGNNMASVKSNPALPIFDDASIAPFGVKIMGNFLFERKLGEVGTGIGTGYVSPGHNSAYYDAASGKYFLIFHSRFPARGEAHEIRVHQMFMNADGWPVVAPYRYANESLSTVRRDFVVGEYLLVNHAKDISASIKKSQYISLNTNGTVTGAASGSWLLVGDNQVEINLTGAPTFRGVLVNQWDETAKTYTLTFSALSNQGVAIYGSKLLKRTDLQIVNAIKAELTLGDTSAVTNNISLPTEGARNASISWASSNPAVVSNSGVVTRPEYGAGDAMVTLTASIKKGTTIATKSFVVVVREKSMGGLIAHYAFDNNLADSTGVLAAGNVSGARIDWLGGNLSYTTGVKGSAAVFDGNTGVRLPNGIISSNKYTVSLWLKPTELTAFTTTFFGARTGDAWISLLPMGHGWVNGNTMLWSGTVWYDAGLGMNIPVNQWSHLAFSVNNGAVNVYVNGVKKFSGVNFPNIFTNANGIFSLGVNWWDIPYKGAMDDLRIYETSLSDAQIQSLSF